MKRIKSIGTSIALKAAYHALFELHVRYGITLWGSSSAGNLHRVLVLQKRVMRIMAGLHPQESCPEETLKENLEKPVHEEQEESKESDSTGTKKEEESEGNKSADSSSSGDEKKNTTNKEEDKKKPKVVVIKEPIVVNVSETVVPAMGEEHLQQSIAKIDALNQFDAEKSRREGALNALESFVFDVKTKLEDEEEYKSAATQTELESITKLYTEMMEWLDDEGLTADANSYEKKLSELKSLTKPVWKRVAEANERPEAIAALLATINGSRNFLTTIKNMSEAQVTDPADPPMFTQIELDTLGKVINETQEWLDKIVVDQEKLAPHETPVLTVRSLVEKMGTLDREVKYLVNKAKIWKPKIKKEDSTKDATSNKTTEKEKEDSKSEKQSDKIKIEEFKEESVLETEELRPSSEENIEKESSNFTSSKEKVEDDRKTEKPADDKENERKEEEEHKKTETPEDVTPKEPSTTETKTDEDKHTEL
ncbi:Hypoxia up-regulated protein 1 [Homalodisca vitripennis]|nr:Hypoxia up-regulated protein 1 [Homalodisca vitripennis]